MENTDDKIRKRHEKSERKKEKQLKEEKAKEEKAIMVFDRLFISIFLIFLIFCLFESLLNEIYIYHLGTIR